MQIAMLGPLEVRGDDGALAEVPGARLRGLLVALALRPGHVVPKASLLDWIWGENPPAEASNALQRLVSRLRKVLPDAAVEGLNEGYRLTVGPDEVDAVRFERLISAGQAAADDPEKRARLLREALGLWRGAAMQDVGLQESEAFDAAVVRLDGRRLTATEEHFDAELALGRGAELVTQLTDLVAAYPMRERLTAALMRALAAAGRSAEALQVYQHTREVLADALGVDPSPELAALHVALLRGELGRREEPQRSSAQKDPAQPRRTNLRAELTSFVGRADDVAAVRELVAEHRLTSVLGPGGAGKTRLAGETARTLLDDLPDGAWLVELAPIGPDGDVAQAALSALGLRDPLLGDGSSAEPIDRFVTAMRERDALLVLDNCEHVIETAAVFAHRVLGECRRLRILATSREPLGITGEALWQLQPLTLPAADSDPDTIEASPAVQLLRDRAGALRHDLGADAATLATMARICRALDGSPLAIELAAARLRTMSLEQLANRLDDRFRLLTGGSRTALPRHRTLRAVVDWSWELLSEGERVVLRRLAVFSGGAGLAAAEQVCSGVGGTGRSSDTGADGAAIGSGVASDAGVYPEEVLEHLTTLTEKSLLVADDGPTPRYRMSGIIREYAAQRLIEAGEADLARRAHVAYFTRLAETAEPHLRRAEQLEWVAVLEADHDNISAALRGAVAAGEAQAAMQLAAGAGWYWWLAGHRSEGMELLTAATRLPGDVTDEARATVYALVVMFMSSGNGDERYAAEWIHKAYEAGQRAKNDHPGRSLSAPLETILRTPEKALTAFEPALSDPDPWVRAIARLQMGKTRILAGLGGPEADEYLEAALAEFQALGERFGISFALSEVAERKAGRGDFLEACDLLEQGIEAVGAAGAFEDVIRMRARQAQLYRLAGDRRASAAALADAKHKVQQVTWPDTRAELALTQAELARWDGDREEAYGQVGVAISALAGEDEQVKIHALTQDLLGYLTDDPDRSREHRSATWEAVTGAGHIVMIARALVGLADLALRRDQTEQAARLLAAAVVVRGEPDRADPDAARLEQEARSRLGDTRFAEAAEQGTQADFHELARVTLAC